MSHIKFQRKRTDSLKLKAHSQQSRSLKPPQPLRRLINESISKRRRTTHNSPDFYSIDESAMIAEMQEAKQAYKNKNMKHALFMFKKIYKKHPKNSQVSYFIGSCYLNEGNFQSALSYFKTCLLIDSNFNKNIYIFMAICYKAINKFKQAINVLNQGLQKYPRFKDGHFYKGKILMKLLQFQQAIQQFQFCLKIQSNNNQMTYLMLGDCLRHLGHFDQALQRYTTYIDQSQNKCEKGIIKKVSLLIQLKRVTEAKVFIETIQQKGLQFLDLTYFKGLCDYQLGNYSQAITSFQLTLSSCTSTQIQIAKSLRNLIQIRIKQKDFFGAQHLVMRSTNMNINKDNFILYSKLVQGINDLIKKKYTQCQQKLSHVYQQTLNKNQQHNKFLFQSCSPYYAYCLFSMQNYDKALQVYQASSKNYHGDKYQNMQKCNQLICQGIILHKNLSFPQAQQKFQSASLLIQNRIQPIFLICINIIQQLKKGQKKDQSLKIAFQKLNKLFQQVQQSNLANSLFLFYQSLALLFQGKNACHVIDQAIHISEQQVSQYFFIQALAYSLAGQNYKSLQSITKAIQLDQNIPQFFKERSKYYYILEKYEDAATDIAKVLDQTNDDQAKLLLAFYYYMTEDYSISLSLLYEVSEQCSQDKLRQFEMALNFRLHEFQKCGPIGVIINAIIQHQEISQEFISKNLKTRIIQKKGYSQFTIYHFHLILSAYYYYRKVFDKCLQHLFGAIQQIQSNFESQQQFSTLSQKLLNQIKFNIAITCLLKQSQQNQQNLQFPDTCKYLKMFIDQTQDLYFITCMKQLLKLLTNHHKQPNHTPNQSKVINIQLLLDLPKLSNYFPQIIISIGNYCSIKTKFLLSYPKKLKFNISPQFDQGFLYNFDVDKIQSKLCPPWFKFHDGNLFFTDKIRNQQVYILETSRQSTPVLPIVSSPRHFLRKNYSQQHQSKITSIKQ